MPDHGTPIDTIVKELPRPNHIKSKLNRLNLSFIEQCTTYKNDDMLFWFQLPHNTKYIPRGREPRWYQLLTETICQQLRTTLKDNFITLNPYTYKDRPTQKAEWAIERSCNTKFVGQISSIKNNNAVMNHWTIDRATSQLHLCADCYQNNPLLGKKKCTRRIHISSLAAIIVNSKKRIRASVVDLMQIEKAKPISKTPLHISLKINYIDKLIKDNETKNILEEVQSKLRKQKTAVLHLVPQQCKIEKVIEEVITCSILALDYRMHISTPNWPTTTRKLIAALIHIALMLPKKVKVLVITMKKHFANMARAIYETPVHALHTLYNKTYGPSWLT
ncbi:hypothetical protein C2G38_1316275 [Gigaspora rosea]|uniref:Uncharacterized protein n=1 Tax=Gigaspora rosea TaxID=44941 RepID=A0A397V8V7_9GLOM|nr:hypothetical protein C2G38_1316275 [Gigaspora rosea]